MDVNKPLPSPAASLPPSRSTSTMDEMRVAFSDPEEALATGRVRFLRGSFSHNDLAGSRAASERPRRPYSGVAGSRSAANLELGSHRSGFPDVNLEGDKDFGVPQEGKKKFKGLRSAFLSKVQRTSTGLLLNRSRDGSASSKSKATMAANGSGLQSDQQVDAVDSKVTALPTSYSMFNLGAAKSGRSTAKLSERIGRFSTRVTNIFHRRNGRGFVDTQTTIAEELLFTSPDADPDDAHSDGSTPTASRQTLSTPKDLLHHDVPDDLVPHFGDESGTVGGVANRPVPELPSLTPAPFKEKYQDKLPVRGTKMPRVNPLRLNTDVMKLAEPEQAVVPDIPFRSACNPLRMHTDVMTFAERPKRVEEEKKGRQDSVEGDMEETVAKQSVKKLENSVNDDRT